MPQYFSDNDYIYSVDMMFAFLLQAKYHVSKIPIADLEHVLRDNTWGDPKAGIAYSAIDVINKPRKYQDEYRRIMKADLNFPIIVTSRMHVVDGVHRLSKAYLEKRTEINAYVFPDTLMRKFIVENLDGGSGWQRIGNWQTYQIIDLYHQRFCKEGRVLNLD